jgi:hypothetical protein
MLIKTAMLKNYVSKNSGDGLPIYPEFPNKQDRLVSTLGADSKVQQGYHDMTHAMAKPRD